MNLEAVNFLHREPRGDYVCLYCGQSYKKMVREQMETHARYHADEGLHFTYKELVDFYKAKSDRSWSQRYVSLKVLAIKKMAEGGEGMETEHNGKMGKAITEEEFKKIKELQFTGETFEAIAEKIGRSHMPVKRVMRSETYDDFIRLTTIENSKYTEAAKAKREGALFEKNIPELKPKDRYGNLRLFREKLDTVLVDFILGEVDQKIESVIAENKILKEENVILKKQLEEALQPDFMGTLAKKLEQNPLDKPE